MQRHDGFPGTGRAGDTGRTVVVALHHASLGRMEEYDPALPRVIECPPQLLDVGHHTEASLRVRVRKRVFMSGERSLSIRRDGLATPLDPHGVQRWRLAEHARRRLNRRATRREFQQRLGCLRRQVVGEIEQGILGRRLHVIQPLDGNAVAKQLVVRGVREDLARLIGNRGGRGFDIDVPGNLDFAHHLANLHDLGCTRSRMLLETPSLRPAVRRVVMIDVAEQKVRTELVDDQAQVAADSHGPEVLVLRTVNLVELHPGVRRVHLQVEGSGLDRLLLVTRELRETRGERVGDSECDFRARHRPSPRSGSRLPCTGPRRLPGP